MATKKPKQKIHGAAKEAALKTGGGIRSMVVQGEREDFDEPYKCLIKASQHKERLTISLEGKKKQQVRGFFAVVERDAKGNLKVSRHLIQDTGGLKQFLESAAFKKSRKLEADPFALGIDSTASSTGILPPNNEYTPIMGGPFSIQQYLYDYLAAHAKCFEAKNHNPLAKEIVDVITFFSLGKGVKVLFRSPQMQRAWDEFEKRNKFAEFIRMDSDTITWAGEIGTHKTHFPDGFPAIKHIDMSTVWEIITNPRDITEVFYYHQQFPTQYQLIYKPGDVASEYVVNDIPADEVIHKKINTVPGEKRGRADLFNILGWLKRFKDYYDARITKAQIEESFAIKKKVKGSGTDVDALFSDPAISAVPTSGSVLIENEAIDTTFMTPTASSSGGGIDNVGEAIRSIVATGAGLAPEYLGVGGQSSTRATSITKSEPSARKFEDRQMFFETYIREIADWVMTELMKKGMVPKTQLREANLGALKRAVRVRDWKAVMKEALALMTLGTVTESIDKKYEVIFPEISSEDRTAKLKDIAQTQALRYISRERAATMTAKELGITSYDYDEEQEKIREEALEAENDPAYTGIADPAAAMFIKTAPAAAGGGAAGEAPAGKPGSKASNKDFKDQARKS